MRILGAALLATSLLATNAFAADTLPTGKPAGVKKAQEIGGNALLIIAGVGLAGLGIGLATSSGNSGGPTTSVNTVTGTQP